MVLVADELKRKRGEIDVKVIAARFGSEIDEVRVAFAAKSNRVSTRDSAARDKECSQLQRVFTSRHYLGGMGLNQPEELRASRD